MSVWMRGSLASALALGALALLLPGEAEASHARGATLTWEQVGFQEAEFQGSFAARTSYFGSLGVGSLRSIGDLRFGDGGTAAAYVQVTSKDVDQD